MARSRPAKPRPSRRSVDTFVRAIETSDFDRRLQLVEDDFASRARAEANGGPRMRFNF
jgi:hypothetical protein